MRFFQQWLLPAAAVLTLTACEKKLTGDGPVVSQERQPAAFSRIILQVPATLYFTQETDTRFRIDAQQNILDEIETPVFDGEMRIRFKDNKNLGRHDPVVMRISNAVIQGLRLDGSANIQASSTIQASSLDLGINGSGNIVMGRLELTDRLTARISGSGSISALEGTAHSANLRISGSGNISVSQVLFQTAETEISGSGDIRLSVEDRLDAKISGSGSVYYRGNPAVNANISGSGSVKQL
ncbi:MAG: DUF2807 domain-containing protein [Candidatus Pseudobacter hemicellulosilyticus]|uniref:DUF2807 domain-containing protein n=1 Tax=Candidatus Pseudobacter hemicellulosilyticus TaxID=3121375 RepID=A0AAJ6BJ00_9BACT|nr:MAG: DUF2807 domain-containing protein [Pseudobacter sp.]